MSAYGGPEINDSGLVLALDAANTRSYPGSGTTWTDLSGNGLNATIGNSPTFSSSHSGILTYSGGNSGATATGTSSLFNVGTGDFTVELWVNVSSFPPYSVAFSLDDNLSGLGIIVYLVSSPYNFRTWIGNTDNNSVAQIATDTWYHLVISRLSGTVSKYINGSLDSTHVASGSCSTGQTAKIAWRYGAAYNYTGSVGIVRFYNSALTAAQVAQNYNATSGRYLNQRTPNQISGLSLWLDASDPETVYQDSAGTTLASANDNPVGMWKDRSGNARHATQVSSLASRPTFKTNVRNNRPAVYFDGSGTWLSNTVYSYSGVSTLFIVASNTYDNGYYFDGAAGGIVRGTARYSQTTAKMFAPSTELLSAASFNLSNISLIECYWNSTSSQLGVNGQIGSATSVPLYTLSGYTVGRTRNGSGAGISQGNFCEILHYERILDAAERKQIESYLNAKWSIY
jgi:hypothetical protein